MNVYLLICVISDNEPATVAQNLNVCENAVRALIQRYTQYAPNFQIHLFIERLFKKGDHAHATQAEIVRRLKEIIIRLDELKLAYIPNIRWYVDDFYNNGARGVPEWIQPSIPTIYPNIQTLIQGYFDFARLALGSILIKDLMQPLLLDFFGRMNPNECVIYQDLDIRYVPDLDMRLVPSAPPTQDPNAWFANPLFRDSHLCYMQENLGFDVFWTIESGEKSDSLEDHPFLQTFLNNLLGTFRCFADVFSFYSILEEDDELKKEYQKILSETTRFDALFFEKNRSLFVRLNTLSCEKNRPFLQEALAWLREYHQTPLSSSPKLLEMITSCAREVFMGSHRSIFERTMILKYLHHGHYHDGAHWVMDDERCPRAFIFGSDLILSPYIMPFAYDTTLEDLKKEPYGIMSLVMKANRPACYHYLFFKVGVEQAADGWTGAVWKCRSTGATKTVWGRWSIRPKRPSQNDLDSDPLLKHIVVNSEAEGFRYG